MWRWAEGYVRLDCALNREGFPQIDRFLGVRDSVKFLCSIVIVLPMCSIKFRNPVHLDA